MSASATDAAWETYPVGELVDTVVIGPSTRDETVPEALLLVVPGAFLSAADYKAYVTALQAASQGKVQLWVAFANVDWSAAVKLGFDPVKVQAFLDQVEQAFDAIVKKTQEQGFKAHGSPVRYGNVYMAAHSAGTLYARRYAYERAGGYVLLASRIQPFSENIWPSLAQWARPVCTIAGGLDGMMRPTRVALSAVEAAACTAKYGARYVAKYKPVVILPGINHGHFSNGVVNVARGDIHSDVPLGEAAKQIAEVTVHFLTAHVASARHAEVADQAVDNLLQHVVDTAAAVSPFTEALGRGNPAAVHDSAASDSWGLPSTLAGIIPGAVGSDVFPDSGTGFKRFIAHPGEIQEAERFASKVASSMAAHLPPAARQRLQFAATAHVDVEQFVFDQPAIVPMQGGRFLVNTPVYINRPGISKVLLTFAPEYFIKLKGSAAIEMALGIYDPANPPKESVTAQSVGEAVHDKALRLVPAHVRELYLKRGKQLSFLPDRDVTKQMVGSPKEWILDHPLRMETTNDGKAAQVCSPVIATEAKQFNSYETGPGRFSGNYYIKVLSVAATMEWIMVDSLREHAPTQ